MAPLAAAAPRGGAPEAPPQQGAFQAVNPMRGGGALKEPLNAGAGRKHAKGMAPASARALWEPVAAAAAAAGAAGAAREVKNPLRGKRNN